MLIMLIFFFFSFPFWERLDIHVLCYVCSLLSECVPRICTTWLMWPEQAWIALACTMWSIVRIVQSLLRLVTQFAVWWKVYWITLGSLKVPASLIPKVAIGHDSKPVWGVGGGNLNEITPQYGVVENLMVVQLVKKVSACCRTGRLINRIGHAICGIKCITHFAYLTKLLRSFWIFLKIIVAMINDFLH